MGGKELCLAPFFETKKTELEHIQLFLEHLLYRLCFYLGYNITG